MPDNTPVEWTLDSNWLHSTFIFKSYSDASLAELCFDDELPLPLLQKVFRVFLDPDFKLEDVTFKSAGDICQYLSDCRKENLRARSVVVNSFAANEHTSVTARPGVVPPVILDFVVDQFMDERGVLTDLAPWEGELMNAFHRNSAEFCNMSLVHRSWTPIAQRGLRKRVMIGCKYIKTFLLNPFCGPQVTELAIDWMFTDGLSFPTKNDIGLLDELLQRTPNVRSLVFNTSLSRLQLDPYFRSLKVDDCLEIIAERLPRLENLWLEHVCRPETTSARYKYSSDFYQEDVSCTRGQALCDHLPKLLSLKFLSLRGWDSGGRVDCDTHLPSQLQSVVLDALQEINNAHLNWLLDPGGKDNLDSLSITISERKYHHKKLMPLDDCWCGVKRLALYADSCLRHTGLPRPGLLEGFKELISLDFHAKNEYDYIGKLLLPPSLERLSVHYYDGSIKMNFPNSSELTPAGEVLVSLVRRNLPSLHHLQTLLVTTREGADGISGPGELVQDGLPEELLDICSDHDVEVNRR